MRDAIRSAIERGDLAEFLQLVEDDPAAAEARDAQGLSPLMVALYRGQTEIADYLLSRGPELDLFEAAAVGYRARVAELLLEAATEPRSPDGFTALQLASYFGRTETVRLLLERRADVRAVSENAMRIQPLHAAVSNRHAEIVGLLLTYGADANARQQGGWTPLHAAVQNRDTESIRSLLRADANPELANDEGKTARDLAGDEAEITRLFDF